MAKKKIPVWTMKGLAILLCKKEGLKKQVSVAQMQEILGHLADMIGDENTSVKTVHTLCVIAAKRSQKAAKAKKK